MTQLSLDFKVDGIVRGSIELSLWKHSEAFPLEATIYKWGYFRLEGNRLPFQFSLSCPKLVVQELNLGEVEK